MNLPLLKNANVNGKTVFLRADLDVPLSEFRIQSSEFRIEDDTRLVSAMPTIEYLLKNNAKIIIGGHLGRPKPQNSEFRIQNSEFSLKPVAHWFASKLNHNSQFIIHDSSLGGLKGWEIGPSIFLLENLRFNAGEETNDPEFGTKLASLADIYVNDAFAMCHRNHASIVGIAHFLPHFAGLHLQKEIISLSRGMENPKRPLVVIVGGKKIETKLPLVSKMHRIADYVLVGGKIAQESKKLAKEQHENIKGQKAVLLIADSNSDKTDITEKDAENFLQIIVLAKTIIWNGSMGIIENEKLKMKNDPFDKTQDHAERSRMHEKLDTEYGTRLIANGIIESGAHSIVGGGDTVEYLNKLGILDKFSFASTGGGAMLSFLSGEKLPGIEALMSS